MATQGVWSWSHTPGSNGNADASINFQEGQAPSSLNDSARALMSRVAEWRDDISGTITTAGSSTAYTVASNTGFDSLAHLSGAMIAFVPHVTNGATVTLNVDGLGAKPLRYGPSKELQSGVLIQGTPYVATYNNSDAAFYLRNIVGDPYGIPLGGLLPYTGTTAPNSAFLLPSGQAISRTTYATYFALVGTTFGTGDGSTTFNVLDLRGRFIAGLDNMNGSAASRITVAGGNFDGTTLGTTGGAQNKTISQGNLPNVTLTTTITDPGHHHATQYSNGAGPSGAGPQNVASSGSIGSGLDTLNATTGITASTALGGSGTALAILPPSMVLPFILRVI